MVLALEHAADVSAEIKVSVLEEFKECEWCHQPFLPALGHLHQKYCDKNCFWHAFRRKRGGPLLPLECSICHKVFTPKRKLKREKGVCCSNKCQNILWRNERKFKVKPLECVICHKIFTPKRKLRGDPACSEKCRQASHYKRNRENKRRYRKEHYVPKIRAARKCKRCGAVFQPAARDGPLPVFCSDFCAKTSWKARNIERIRATQDLKGFSQSGTILRLKTVMVCGQERIADAVFLEQQLGKERPRDVDSPKASWRFQRYTGT